MPAHSQGRLLAVTLLGAALAAGCGDSDNHDRGRDKPSHAASPRPVSGEQIRRAEDAFAQRLTKALRDADRRRFVSAFTGSARTRASGWWRNVKALGVTTGTVAPEVGQGTRGDDGLVVLDVGLHNRLDPRPEGKSAQPYRRYRVRLISPGANGGEVRADRWTPVDGPAPWDEGKLTVRKAPGVVVAAPADEAELAERALPQAKDASRWLREQMRINDPELVAQRGFVVFVSASKKRRNGWFARVEHLRGWTGDAGGYAKPLPQMSDTTAALAGIDGDSLAHGLVATSAIVVKPPPPGRRGGGLLIHEMTHALFSPATAWLGEDPPPAWPTEGLARYIETQYVSTFMTSPDADILRGLVRSGRFTGKPPSNDDLYGGTAEQGDRAYAVAASAFRYLRETYGAPRMIAAAQVAGSTGDPFAGIVADVRGDVARYHPPAKIRAAWAAWVRSRFG